MGQAHHSGMDVQPVGDELHRRARVAGGGDDAGGAVPEGGHGVKEVRRVARARVVGRHRRVVVGGGVAEGDGAGLADLADRLDAARLLRRDGDEPHNAAARLVEPVEHRRVRGVDVVGVLRAALGVADKGAFQVDARHLRAVGGTLEIADDVHRTRQLRLLERHGRRTPRGHALCGIVARHLRHALRLAVAGVLAHGGVGVDVNETGDQIAALRVDAAVHSFAHSLDRGVKIKSAVHERAAYEYLGVGYFHRFALT